MLMRLAALSVLSVVLCGCGSSTHEAGKPGAPEASKPAEAPAKTSRWKQLEAGLEFREEDIKGKGQSGESAVHITAVRLEPKVFRLSIRTNTVTNGKTIAEVATEPGVVAVTNGAYFGTKDEPVTLLVSGGKALSKRNTRLTKGGFFTLDGKGRAAVVAFKDFEGPAADADFLIQNSPLLVSGGRVVFVEPKSDNQGGEAATAARHRRTVLGLDGSGRVVLMVTGSVSLADLAGLLAASESDGGWGLTGALNLDGGPSTGMAMEHTKATASVPAMRIIPHLVVVERRK